MALRLTFDHDCLLIGETGETRDEYGNMVTTDSETPVQCYMRSATRAERANAGHLGFKAEFVLGLHSFEYSGQGKVLFQGRRFDVLTDYLLDNLVTEITIGEKIGG